MLFPVDGEISPEGRCHLALFYLVVEEKTVDLFARQQFHVEVFGLVEVALAVGFDAYGKGSCG